MSTSIFDRIVQNAKMRLPGAVDDALKLELFNMLDNFFTTSSIWREAIDVTITPGTLTYDIEPESSNAARIIRLLSFQTTNTQTDIPVTMSTPGEIVLNRDTTTTLACVATVALSVGDTLDNAGYPFAPDWITDKYFNGLIDGLVGRMMIHPAKPYSNEKLSIFHLRSFNGTVSQARVDANHANLHRAQNWRFPGGWTGPNSQTWAKGAVQ